jgi:hypothetical protein
MGNQEAKYSAIDEEQIELIDKATRDVELVKEVRKDYNVETIVSALLTKTVSSSYDTIIKSIENNFIHRSELKIIFDTLIQTNNFDEIFPENFIMFRLDIQGILMVLTKNDDKYQLQEYIIDTTDYSKNHNFVTYLIPFLPYLNNKTTSK